MANEYVIPSSRFSRGVVPPPAENPASSYYVPSIATNAAPSASQAYIRPTPAAVRPDSTTKTPEQIKAEADAANSASMAGAASAGFQNTAVPGTTDVTSNVVSVLGNTAAGAAEGAAAGSVVGGVGAVPGAIIGGGIALVTSGLNAWVGNRQARAERDRANAIMADNRRIAAQDRADLEKWRVINHLDTLEAAKESRRRYNMEYARQTMQNTATNMQNILATSANAKQQWAQFGFK